MADLAGHWDYLQTEWQAAQAAPLSRRRALLVAALIDAYVDRLFAAAPDEGDILAFRTRLAGVSPALALVFALCAQHDDGTRLVVEAVEVPIADYGSLGVEDFMVSLYNDHSVQRVLIGLPDGSRPLAQTVLADAMVALSSYSRT
ncbi:hypothetical protein [Devosia sp. SL43]|uniref:hypothetical protein n=1 Tax=Devosia sp. SL43 TaxID=2806348 RepID=UPI001F23257A|nr:hypothetical protein [Devosia sp. SL43]UJW85588.1 hypothetical protein IM737_19710 [Devosia sp. SL43]